MINDNSTYTIFHVENKWGSCWNGGGKVHAMKCKDLKKKKPFFGSICNMPYLYRARGPQTNGPPLCLALDL
jgi:hypothetical protein